MVEIRQIDMSYDGGVYEVIANNSKALPQDRKLPARRDPREAVYDTLDTITQATQQQMDLFRRMMYLMTVLLLIVFLTAAASLALTVMMLISGNTLSLHQPTSSPKTTSSGSTRCVERVSLQEMKIKISELEEALNLTRYQLDELRTELKTQKKAIANLTETGIKSRSVRRSTGTSRPQGVIGLPGSQGAPGPMGLNGTKGPEGPMGPRGLNGSQGPSGLPGNQGPSGPPGNQGPSGPAGNQGPMGPPGYNASSSGGGAGAPGLPGPPGRPGAGNLTLCQYKNKKEAAQTAGASANSVVILREDDHQVSNFSDYERSV
ncbi:hypothetical protein OS493_030775 [Desmophyllum pertusum]|uniref:Uncharacterized protein n=1 Tax=Desmophyllum pertusum TaxID=174260 RepID=A0A9X0CPJ1_9CNID|nr:hypothetical protein OS493_030775 [Desmophyllum pertusum]